MKSCRSLFVIVVLAGLCSQAADMPQKKMNLQYEQDYIRLYKALTPAMQNKLKSLVERFQKAMIPLEPNKRCEDAIIPVIRAAGSINMDVSSVAFLVMMMAVKNMDEDIRMIMAEIKAMTAAKQKLREQVNDLNQWISETMKQSSDDTEDIYNANAGNIPIGATSTPKLPPCVKRKTLHYKVEFCTAPVIIPLPRLSRAQLDRWLLLRDNHKKKLDQTEEMSTMLSLQLQMMMDHLSKCNDVIASAHQKINLF